jgi:hypothetical protein
MSDVSLMMQAAVIAALKDDTDLTAEISERIYDSVPSSAQFPYVTFRVPIVVDDSADCITGSEVFFDIHIWSRATGWPEASRIAGIVRASLDEAEFNVTDHNLINLHFRDFRRLDDPDGKTNHGVVSFRALIDAE